MLHALLALAKAFEWEESKSFKALADEWRALAVPEKT